MTLPTVFPSSVGGDNSIFPLPGKAEELSVKSGKAACRDINPSVVRQGVISRQKIVSLALCLRILLFHMKFSLSILTKTSVYSNLLSTS